jgi:peptidoglycan lytic transglycosylase
VKPMSLRARRPLVVAGALAMITIPAAVAPPAARGTDAVGEPIPFALADRHLRYGERLAARGRVPEAAGRLVTLVQRTAGTWRPLATTTARGDGAFRLVARLTASGDVRVLVPAGPARAASAAAVPVARVAVAPRLATAQSRLDVLAGRRAIVRGAVAPGGAGRRVALEVRRGGAWRTADRDRTDGRGRFALGLRTSRTGSLPVRVRFAGDGANAPAARALGRLNVYRAAAASWYGPGLYGSRLACGGRLSAGTLGVANKSLPCGARVTLRYRGRSVRVPVVDRGPFAGGREYDLTAATAQRLGFRGTGAVLTTR